MTAYLLTEAQHAQLVDAAESNAEYTEAEYMERRDFWGEALDYRWKNLQEASEQAMATLAMLKAMKPVEPHSWYSAVQDESMTDKLRKDHERLGSYTHKHGKYDLPLYALGDTA